MKGIGLKLPPPPASLSLLPDGFFRASCWQHQSPDVGECITSLGNSSLTMSLKEFFGDSFRKAKNSLVIPINSSTQLGENFCAQDVT